MAVGLPLKTTYANGDVFSASDINDTNGTINLIGYGAPVVAGKNGVINGGMDVWQRGTSSAGNAYICDRWYSALISGTGTFARETTVIPSGSNYSQKFTASATAQPALYQVVETLNAVRFANQSVTVSAKVASSTSVGFTIDVQYSTSTDNGVTGTWTSITATSGGTATATSTTFVAISGVYAVPSTAKSLRVRLFTTSTIANTVVVYFGQVQLEQGTTATTFSLASGTIQGEIANCQRYYYLHADGGTIGSIIGMGAMTGTDIVEILIAFPTSMRIIPTAISATGTSYYRFDRAGASDDFNSITGAYLSINGADCYNNTQISGTAGQAGSVRAINDNSLLSFNAEL